MKIRAGFVSNSSSSSFVVVGKTISFEEFKRVFKVDLEKFYNSKDEPEEYEFEEYILESVRAKKPKSTFEAMPFGCVGEWDEVLLYYSIPEKPKDAIKVIEDAVKNLGEDVIISSVMQDSESGNFFGE